jgi:hypothetical protein
VSFPLTYETVEDANFPTAPALPGSSTAVTMTAAAKNEKRRALMVMAPDVRTMDQSVSTIASDDGSIQEATIETR